MSYIDGIIGDIYTQGRNFSIVLNENDRNIVKLVFIYGGSIFGDYVSRIFEQCQPDVMEVVIPPKYLQVFSDRMLDFGYNFEHIKEGCGGIYRKNNNT